MTTATALVVDRRGLARKLAHRPKAFVLYELLQNAWDENVTSVALKAEMIEGRPVCHIIVADDAPDGFSHLESIYTLFRDSKKGSDPEKRGRFELGEKLVAALALRMEVCTTKGTVIIEGDERRHTRARTGQGSVVTVDIRMTRDEFAEACEAVRRLLPPAGITTTFNGERLEARAPLHQFETTLQTMRTDDDGNLAPTQRKTEVRVYELLPGETAHLYEMGIPVVETGDRYHYDVQQRVPVNWERNSVPPAYLRTLRVEALNALHEHLRQDDAVAPWVSDAIDDARCAPEAVQEVVEARFGKKTVIFDPSDPEGTKLAVSQGYTVITGGAFSKGAWEHIREHNLVLPAGQVTPSPKPYSPEGRGERVIPTDKWTDDMTRRAEFSWKLFLKLNRISGTWDPGGCHVVIVNEPTVSWGANFGKEGNDWRLCLNHGRLGKRWFALPNRNVEVLDLLLHEFCHQTVSDHLSHEMHEAATRLGAQLANLALNEPEFFT